MKDKVVKTLLAVGFVGGLAISLYPLVSNLHTRQSQMNVIDQYQEEIEKIDRSLIASEKELALTYNKKLNQTIILSDPFDPNAISLADDAYYDILNFTDDGIMAYITIPKINVNLPVYHGTDKEHMLKGVGHLVGTSLPIGGHTTHAVLSAHSGLSSADLFTNLENLISGDLFFIHVLDETLAYQVDQIKTVLPTETSDLRVVSNQDYVTLVTCTPYGINSHRLLVRGHRIEYDEKQEEEQAKKNNDNIWLKEYLKSIFGGLGIIVVLLLGSLIIKKIRYWRKR